MALQWHKVIKYDPENKILMLAAEPGIWKSDRGMVFTPETPTDTERVPETTDVQKWKSKGKGCGASQPAAGCLKSFLKKQRRNRWFRHLQRVFGRRPTWETLAFTGRFDPDILRAALPQNVDGQDAEGGTN